MQDQRPDPNPRKQAHLWQAYLWWYELMEMRKRHNLRISSIERGKSNLDAQFEQDMLDTVQIDTLLKQVKKMMVIEGRAVGPVWDWLTSIKGLSEGGLAAQLLAQIDDIDSSPTVASLWRFAGFAVIGGKAEKNSRGEKSKFNRRLKGVCFNIADSFIKQQTPHYVDIYYAEKERLRALYPDTFCRECSFNNMRLNRTKEQKAEIIELDDSGPLVLVQEAITEQLQGYLIKWDDCQAKKSHHKIFNDAHVHNRAWRKMIKEFLKDLWVEWKQAQ